MSKIPLNKWTSSDVFVDRAEGDVIVGSCRYPYVTELAGPNGCSVVIWRGDQPKEGLEQALACLIKHRDIVQAYWSEGNPTSYWNHGDIHA